MDEVVVTPATAFVGNRQQAKRVVVTYGTNGRASQISELGDTHDTSVGPFDTYPPTRLKLDCLGADTGGVGELVVVTGPIAAGKSTVAAAVGDVVRDAGLAAAVVDLDDIVASLCAPGARWRRSWDQARRAHAALTGGWLRSGVEMVLAHGPFHDGDEVTTLLSEVPAGTVTRWCWLDVAYDVAMERTAADPTRDLSRDPGFVRRSHDRVAALAGERPTPTWAFDTRVTPLDTIVASVADDLLTAAGRAAPGRLT